MPFNEVFFTSLAALVGMGVLVTYAIKFFAQNFSALQLVTTLLSLVVGSIVAAIIILCGRVVFGGLAIPAPIEIFLRFLLPFTTTVLAFFSLRYVFDSFSLRRSGATDDENSEESSKKVFLPDLEALEDGRLVDLARTGLFDNQIVIPSFLQKEIKILAESTDETTKMRGKKALESFKRLEAFQKISNKSKEITIPETVDISEKILRTARALGATIITSEFLPLRVDAEPGLYLAIDSIANALRPPIPRGEFLLIKIQRLGKEPKQGIGYLDDGTMVVVNGGGDHLGKTVKTQVLSQKYSSSGKIVFCNVREEDAEDHTSSFSYTTTGVG
jgi:uncharacterized protein YacL